MKKSGCILWAGMSYRLGNTVINIYRGGKEVQLHAFSTFTSDSLKCPIHCQLNWAILLRNVNWVNCTVLTRSSAVLRTVLSSNLSHRELHSSLWESHSFLSLPADTTMPHAQDDTHTKKKTNLIGHLCCARERSAQFFMSVFFTQLNCAV
jgi:hypothetical protein